MSLGPALRGRLSAPSLAKTNFVEERRRFSLSTVSNDELRAGERRRADSSRTSAPDAPTQPQVAGVQRVHRDHIAMRLARRAAGRGRRSRRCQEVVTGLDRAHLPQDARSARVRRQLVTVAGMPAAAQCHQPRPGASGSKIVIAKLRVSAGAPCQESCGEWLPPLQSV